jgi:protein gp37
MAQLTKIEWTESSWNPVTGCSKISIGCRNCYAERLALRLQRMGQMRYANGFEVTLQEDLLTLPLKWKKPRIIFVNSMSDLFHGDVPDAFIKKVFETMAKASWHTFQILTKRSKRLASLAPKLDWSDNIWMGVTVESAKQVNRVYDLQSVPAAVHFLSMEPLLSPIPNFPHENIDWIIVGGESGPNARPIEKEWVVGIRDYCISNEIPFFFKQWGGVRKHQNGRLLEGKLWSEYPQKDIIIKNQFRFGV